MQHSGTTYLNNVINSHSRIMSGFECGILLGNINHFEQVIRNVLITTRQSQIYLAMITGTNKKELMYT